MARRWSRRGYAHALVGAAGLLLLGCGTAARDSPQVHLAHLDRWIDPAIPGEAREVLASFMRNLTEDQREAVVVITADGRVYRNRSGLDVQVYRRVAPGIYHSSGHLLPYPEDDSGFFRPADHRPDHLQGCGPTRPTPTGPYRRMRARPGEGPFWYSPGRRKKIRGRVRLPEDTWVVADQLRGVPYVMTGGWAPGRVSAVDAGFLFNTGARDWSLYLLPPGRDPLTALRIHPGTDGGFLFEVVADAQVAVSSSGMTLTAAAPGWRADGLGNQFKRTTSIAQIRENLRSGARLENVWWHDVVLESNVHAQPWSQADTAENCRYPNDDRVTVSADGWNAEWVTIRLPEPTPGPLPTPAPSPSPRR